MPSTLWTTTGTVNDDFVIGFHGANTVNGGDGDDYIIGDSAAVFVTGTSNSFASPTLLDNTSAWTTDENPFFGNHLIPHTTLYVLADAGHTHYSSVTVGAGQTITVDIDFGLHVIGTTTEVVVELYDSSGVLVASDSASSISDGGFGSTHSWDPLLTFINSGGTAETYTIRFRNFDGDGLFEGGETFVANISVTGHAVTTNTVMGDDILNGGNGDDTIAGQGGNDSLFGDDGNDLLLGGSGNDQLVGGAGADVIHGGSGDDTLDGGAGGDSMHGGTGNDIYVVDSDFDEVVENAFAGTDLVQSSISYVLPSNVENLTLIGPQAIHGIGNSHDNELTGNAAANFLMGFNGNDILDGGAGADTMVGGIGNDSYYVDNAGDDVQEHADSGNDTVYSAISYVLTDNVETLRLLGSANINATGNALNNLLVGTAGANILNGGAGADTMWGADGNDIYYVDDAGDSIGEASGAGNDTVYSSVSHTLSDNVETLRLLGSGAINAFGNAGDNLLVGTSGANNLAGGTGNDTLWGGAGDDRMWGENGNDTLDGGAGADEMNGGAGNDNFYVDNAGDQVIEYTSGGTDTVYSAMTYTLGANVENLRMVGFASIDGFGNAANNLLVGNSGANTLVGGAGNDTLWGSDGNDRLIGSSGRDTMAGGAGADRFAFDDGHFGGTTAATADVIQDFSQGQGDLIELAAVDANSSLAGDQAFAFIGTTAFSGTAGELRYEQVGGNTHVYGDTDGDGIADFMVLLNGNLTLTGGDFVI